MGADLTCLIRAVYNHNPCMDNNASPSDFHEDMSGLNQKGLSGLKP